MDMLVALLTSAVLLLIIAIVLFIFSPKSKKKSLARYSNVEEDIEHIKEQIL
jgi:cbb3-type cytochrome oxidase subunit 3